MSLGLLVGLVLALALALLAALSRRRELAHMHGHVRERERAERVGAATAQLQHPIIDLTRCLGCGTCVLACPEDGVLELVHGQALVVRGARCQGIAACARECPTGAITVTLSDSAERRDIPALGADLEAVGSPGLFLAGEVTAHALIKTAIEQGSAVAAAVAARSVERVPSLVGATRRTEVLVGPAGGGLAEEPEEEGEPVLDLCIVGAGPAGLACSLEARRLGLSHVLLDQEATVGGTVARYPRRKLVVTQPVRLPLVGMLERTSYTKEELVALWQQISVEQELPFRGGVVFQGLERDAQGVFTVVTADGRLRARHVCLALGRRGVPRRLGVPGEELSKVAYSLLDARSYQGRRVLVVGGGDSAVEAAVGLAEQPGNEVTLSYRKESFFRIRARSEERLQEALQGGRLRVLYRSHVRAIGPDAVELAVSAGPGGAGDESLTLANDDVFVLAGGVPPFELLERSGVSFDPALRPHAEAPGEQGSGLVRALAVALALSLIVLLWVLAHADYYLLPLAERPAHPKHAFLRPAQGLGLWAGIATSALIVANLLYLVRRSLWREPRLGSLQAWMTSHVATGILAFLGASLHAALAPRDTVGGHAFQALAVLLVTGAVGRYLYAYVPRAANGRELDLAEVKARLGRLAEEWDQGQQRFRERVRDEIGRLIDEQQWGSSFPARVWALVGGARQLHGLLQRLEREGRAEGIDEAQLEETLRVARRAHRTALMAAHYEDLRALLGTWRWLHRWMAALLVLLVVMHVAYALFYGGFFEGQG